MVSSTGRMVSNVNIMNSLLEVGILWTLILFMSPVV